MVVLIKSSSSSLNPKKTILITSLGIFLIGSVYAALKLYYKNKIRNTKSSSNNNKLQNKKIINGRPVSSNASTGNRLGNSRPYSSDYDVAGAKKSTSVVRPLVSERSILLASNCSSQNDIKTFPPEELLELGILIFLFFFFKLNFVFLICVGMNYLNLIPFFSIRMSAHSETLSSHLLPGN